MVGLSICFGVQITYIQSRTWSMSLLLSLNTTGHILTSHGAQSAHQGDSVIECCAMPSVHPQSWCLSSSPASRCHRDLCCSLRFSQYSVAIFTSVLLGLCLAQKIRAPPWAVVNPRRLPSQPSQADVNSLACLPQECPSYLVLNTGIWRPSRYCYLLL